MAQTSNSKSFASLNLTDIKLVDAQLYNVDIEEAKFENGRLVGAGVIKAKILKASSAFGIKRLNNEEEKVENVEKAKEPAAKDNVDQKSKRSRISVEKSKEPTQSKEIIKKENKNLLPRKYHNLAHIDEEKLVERVETLYADRKLNKGNLFITF
jgi:hypothetical protein